MGVLVVSIEPDGPARVSSLRRGDVIVKLNSQPVDSIDALQRRLMDVAKKQGMTRPVTLGVLRDDGKTVLPGQELVVKPSVRPG